MKVCKIALCIMLSIATVLAFMPMTSFASDKLGSDSIVTIDKVEITLQPLYAGTVITGTARQGEDRQTPQPEVSIPSDAKYMLDGDENKNYGLWVRDPWDEEPYEGTVELSEDAYYAQFFLKAKEGLYFTEDCEVILNDENMFVMYATTVSFSEDNFNYLRVNVELHASCHHEWNEGAVTKEPTCTEAGIMTYQCIHCNEKKNEVIPAKHTLNHVINKATLSKNGSEYDQCSVCKEKFNTKTIYSPKTFKLSATKYTYNGKSKNPTVTVKDSKGNKIAASNYDVKCSNNKNVGKATAKITFKGSKYSGSKSMSFTINPKGTTIDKLAPKKKAFTVTLKKQTKQTTGYEIMYSTSSKFKSSKTVTINKNTTITKKIKGLKANKKYYVKVRTYKTVKGTKYRSAWSAKVSVKTK